MARQNSLFSVELENLACSWSQESLIDPPARHSSPPHCMASTNNMSDSAAAVVDLTVTSSNGENITPNTTKREGNVQQYKEKRVKMGEHTHAVICLDDDDDNNNDDNNNNNDDNGSSSFSANDSCLKNVTRSNQVEAAAVAAAAPAQCKTDSTSASSSDDKMDDTEDDKMDDDDEDEEEVAIVGSTGPNALADFPHSRANCVTYRIDLDPIAHCPNCYCYVCDIEAAKCDIWQSHCRANHEEVCWRKRRQDYRDYGRGPAPEASVPRVPLVPPTPMEQPEPPQSRGRTQWACTLRVPTTTVTKAAPPPPTTMDSRHDLQEYSLAALLETITCVYPVEVTPPCIFQTTLRHYQKQSLAFMLDAEGGEQQHQEEGTATRGGWLADELGMGKTAVVLALVATNPMTTDNCPSLEDIKRKLRDFSSSNNNNNHDAPPPKKNKLKVKVTVVMTSVSLLGQWQAECVKHCPSLKVCRYHKSSSGDKITPSHLFDSDVIISSSTFQWESWITENFEFHRVVVDESHLFATASSSAKVAIANKVSSFQKWCVTATPCPGGSVSDLSTQLGFLNSSGQYTHYNSLRAALTSFFQMCYSGRSNNNNNVASSPQKKEAFYILANELQKCMIRHVKSQRINGEEALALPSSSTTTIFLDMPRQEQAWFRYSSRALDDMKRLQKQGGKKFSLERVFRFRMKNILPRIAAAAAPPPPLTKITALLNHLEELRRVEPFFRVVVFTQYVTMHTLCVQAFKEKNIPTFEFTGSVSPRKRDDAIRQFQNQTFVSTNPARARAPAVFCITLGSGNVGITLTAASRVYLMEPTLDPAAHVQAAGRIHRLGQKKAVECFKFVFKNSVESNIVDLHTEIAAGRISIANGFFPREAVQILARGIG
jgi:hypothetical protein